MFHRKGYEGLTIFIQSYIISRSAARLLQLLCGCHMRLRHYHHHHHHHESSNKKLPFRAFFAWIDVLTSFLLLSCATVRHSIIHYFAFVLHHSSWDRAQFLTDAETNTKAPTSKPIHQACTASWADDGTRKARKHLSVKMRETGVDSLYSVAYDFMGSSTLSTPRLGYSWLKTR